MEAGCINVFDRQRHRAAGKELLEASFEVPPDFGGGGRVFGNDGAEGRLEVPPPPKERAPVSNGQTRARILAEHEGGGPPKVFKKQSQFDEVEGCYVVALGSF